MGNFYVNMTAKGPTQHQVVWLLSRQGRSAFVFPTKDGFTTFCDKRAEEQDDRAIRSLAQLVSAELRCAILSVLNHDDDVLWYALYNDGVLSDEYDSFPTYFEGHFNPPKGGDAGRLCNLIGTASREGEVEAILRKPHNEDGYVVETKRHADLAAALGLPDMSVGFGYRYVERGELPGGVVRGDLKQA